MTEYITQSEIARRLGVALTTVKKHTNNGVLPRVKSGNHKGKYKWPYARDHFRSLIPEEVTEAGKICNDPKALAENPEKAKKVGALSTGRVAKLEYEGKLSRLKFEKEQGKLVEKDAIEHAGRNVMKLVRARLLEAPKRVANSVMLCESVGEVEKAIEAAISEALRDLSGLEGLVDG